MKTRSATLTLGLASWIGGLALADASGPEWIPPQAESVSCEKAGSGQPAQPKDKSTAGAERAVLKKMFPLEKAARFVFVEEISIGDKTGYKRAEIKGSTKGALAGAINVAAEQPISTEPETPV